MKTYDTDRLRSAFTMQNVMEANKIHLTYSMYDRLVFGGAVPVGEVLKLEAIDPLKAPYFCYNREVGIIKNAIREAGLDGLIENNFEQAYAFMKSEGEKLGLVVVKEISSVEVKNNGPVPSKQIV